MVVVNGQGWKTGRHLLADVLILLEHEQLLPLLHATLQQPLAISFHATSTKYRID